jgi:hypothetical protein
VERKLNRRNVKEKMEVATASPPSASVPGSRPTNAVSTTAPPAASARQNHTCPRGGSLQQVLVLASAMARW